jgi:predicted ATPase
LALAAETGEHWTDAFLHRIRGEILLKHDPANTEPAEEALLSAIAVAQQQKAKSFELRAALSLAKLHQSSGRLAEAHAVLAPASGSSQERTREAMPRSAPGKAAGALFGAGGRGATGSWSWGELWVS